MQWNSLFGVLCLRHLLDDKSTPFVRLLFDLHWAVKDLNLMAFKNCCLGTACYLLLEGVFRAGGKEIFKIDKNWWCFSNTKKFLYPLNVTNSVLFCELVLSKCRYNKNITSVCKKNNSRRKLLRPNNILQWTKLIIYKVNNIGFEYLP